MRARKRPDEIKKTREVSKAEVMVMEVIPEAESDKEES